MTAKTLNLLLIICLAASISAFAEMPDSKDVAKVEVTNEIETKPTFGESCRTLEIDYSASCGNGENPQSLVHLRNPEDCVLLQVESRSRWNASGLLFKEGVSYSLEVHQPTNTWCDATIKSSPEGWDPDDDKLEHCETGRRFAIPPLARPFLNLAQLTSRSNANKLFTLVGVTSERGAKPFKIGSAMEHLAQADGEFCSYANDSTFTYANNSGDLLLKVTRISE